MVNPYIKWHIREAQLDDEEAHNENTPVTVASKERGRNLNGILSNSFPVTVAFKRLFVWFLPPHPDPQQIWKKDVWM